MKKAQKSFFVDNLKEELKAASSVVLVDYSGLSVKMQQDLKKSLREVNARMIIVKNTLFKLAGKEAKVPDEALQDSVVSGPTALIVTEKDPIAPLQVIAKFSKEYDIPSLKVGIVENVFQNKQALETLSKLPSKEVLYAQVCGAVGGPLYALVGNLQANMQNLISVLEQASKNK